VGWRLGASTDPPARRAGARHGRAVVGVLDFYNVGEMLLAQNRAIRAIAEKAGVSVDLPG
jgi:hypothetical protein